MNATTPIEIIGGAPSDLERLTFNNRSLDFEQDPTTGAVTATVEFAVPEFSLPSFGELAWKRIDSLPEVRADYDDSLWRTADLSTSPNDMHPIRTPVSLYAGDYGYHTGSVVFRGHFVANGAESTLNLTLQGGQAFGASVWLDDVFLGSWVGEADLLSGSVLVTLPPALEEGSRHVITVVLDHMGLNGNYVIGEDNLKVPRGILDFDLAGHDQDDVEWKLTGNLGGERYADRVRGPLNEGGLFAERQGYHLPAPPTWDDELGWEDASPTDGIDAPGVAFYSAEFNLDLPQGYDIPLSVEFGKNGTDSKYRVLLFINGYQYGRFIPHIGPQSRFPVPEGILNHHGTNYVGIMLWAMEEGGARLDGVEWGVSMVTETGFGEVHLSPAPKWEKREKAY